MSKPKTADEKIISLQRLLNQRIGFGKPVTFRAVVEFIEPLIVKSKEVVETEHHGMACDAAYGDIPPEKCNMCRQLLELKSEIGKVDFT